MSTGKGLTVNDTHSTVLISTQFCLKSPKSTPCARINKLSSTILKFEESKTWNTTVTPASGLTCWRLGGGCFLQNNAINSASKHVKSKFIKKTHFPMLRINHTKCSLLYDVSKCNLFQAYRSSSNSRNKCACVMMVAGEQDYIRERKTGPRRTLVLSYVHVFCQNPSAWQES